MSDATMMMRMGNRQEQSKDHGWFIREGSVTDHFRVWPLVATVLFPCLGTLLVGFDMGATAWLMIAIKLCRDGGEKHWCREVENNVILAGMVECMTAIAAMVACTVILLVGASKLGGRTELLLASMFYTVGSTIEAESADMPDTSGGLYVLFAGRFVYGLGVGLSMHAVPAYISENSPAKHRGTLGGFMGISIIVGTVYAYAIGQWLTYEFPHEYPWKYTFKFATVVSIGMFFGMLFLVDSPRWLVSAGRPLYEALEAAQFVNPDLSSVDIVNLKKDIERQLPKTAESVFSRLFCTPALRVPVIVGIGLVCAQQLTGQPPLLNYCVVIFKEVADSHLMVALLCFGGAKFCGSILAIVNLDSSGRRTPLITGLVLMFVATGSLFMLFYDSLQKDKLYQWVFVGLLCLFGFSYEVGVGATTFVLLGEIFPADVRAEALAVAWIVSYALNASMLFLIYFEVTDIGYSVVWGQFAVAAFVFVFFSASLVPETKGKTLEQIQREFQQEFEVPDFEEVVAYLSGDADGDAVSGDPAYPATERPDSGSPSGSAAASATSQRGAHPGAAAAEASSGASGGGTVNPFQPGGDLADDATAETTPLV